MLASVGQDRCHGRRHPQSAPLSPPADAGRHRRTRRRIRCPRPLPLLGKSSLRRRQRQARSSRRPLATRPRLDRTNRSGRSSNATASTRTRPTTWASLAVAASSASSATMTSGRPSTSSIQMAWRKSATMKRSSASPSTANCRSDNGSNWARPTRPSPRTGRRRHRHAHRLRCPHLSATPGICPQAPTGNRQAPPDSACKLAFWLNFRYL